MGEAQVEVQSPRTGYKGKRTQTNKYQNDKQTIVLKFYLNDTHTIPDTWHI
jgi:hypothetical protein